MYGYNVCLIKAPSGRPGWARLCSLLCRRLSLRKGFLAVVKWQEWRKFTAGNEALNRSVLSKLEFSSTDAPIYLHIRAAARSQRIWEEKENKRGEEWLRLRQTFSLRSQSKKLSQYPWEAATNVSSLCYPLIYSRSVCPWGVSLDFPRTNGRARLGHCVARGKLLMLLLWPCNCPPNYGQQRDERWMAGNWLFAFQRRK